MIAIFIGLDEHLPVISSSGNIIFDVRIRVSMFNNELTFAASQVFFLKKTRDQ
jgi:hypothetical protein